MIQTEEARRHAFEQTLLSARRTMLLSETLKLAIDSFRASKLRFALTALGMVIGTASVILVVTIGLTGKRFILEEIQKIGTNSVELEYSGGGATGTENVLYNDYLTREDEKAVVAQVPGVIYSSPVLEMHDRISFGGGVVKDTLVLGVSPQYRYIRNLLIPVGRFLDETDDSAHIKCAVVTEAFAHERYGSPDAALGKEFEISGIPFTIIGVFRQSVDDMGQSEIAEQTILIPYSVARYFTGTENVKQIYFSMRTMEEVPDASREIVRIVSARHRTNSVYKAQNLKELLNTAATISDALTAILVLVAAVTLAVGGVGIMNIMLATVRSRIREIGIRKAMGATYREIKLQFLAEAVIISLAGGVAGTLVGMAVPLSIRLFTNYPLPISGLSVLVALAAATIVGVIFGTVPATRAAQMDPVESLKYE
ncbi:MAG: ABC transporter permease [Acidobacteriota bacterium]|nr:ABC transporter permease [Acidobacteriota bacterium]